MKKYIALLAVLITASASSVQGVAITYFPNDMRGGGTATITGGVLQMTTSGTTDKASYASTWYPTAPNPFGVVTKIGDITAFSYDWKRDSSSTVPDQLQPSIKLMWWSDTDNSLTPTAGDSYGTLAFEYAYNHSGPAPTDSFQTENVLNQYVWEWTTGKGANEHYNVTIPQWAAGYTSGDPNETVLGSNTYIYGIVVEAGSGWDGTFSGSVDNINIGFAGGTNSLTTFDCIPESSSVVFGCLGMIAIVFSRKRH
jgi:hypothetical protein